MGEKKKKTMSMMKALLFIALLPTTIAAFTIAAVGCVSVADSMDRDVYHELYVAAEGMKEYYEWEIKHTQDHQPVYAHDYVDTFLDDDIQLTLFLEDVRYITSIEDPNNPTGRNEGTSADPEIWALVSAGNEYEDKGVKVKGEDYYVAYLPVEDEYGNVIGMAFAGRSQALVNSTINSIAMKFILVTILIVVICGIVVILIARRIKEPLEIIAKNLQLLTEGE